MFRHTHTIGPSDDDDDDDDTVRSVSGRSFALRGPARRRLGRAMEVPSAAASRDPRGLPGDGESRARVESNDAKTSSRRKRRVRRDWTSWLAALTRRTPRRRTRPRRRARRMRPNPVSPYPSPCLAVSVSAPPGGARTSADGAAVKNFFSKAREHRRLPREIGVALAAPVIPASVSGRTRLGANPESTWPNW